MALVSMKEMMIKGKKEGYAIGQFNLNNLEYTQAILQAAEEEQSPVILRRFRRCSTLYGWFHDCCQYGKRSYA